MGLHVWLLTLVSYPQPGAPCNLDACCPGIGVHQFKVGELPSSCPFPLGLCCSYSSSAHCLLCRLMGLRDLEDRSSPSFKIYLCFYGSRLVGILVLRIRIEPMHSAVKAPKLNLTDCQEIPTFRKDPVSLLR